MEKIAELRRQSLAATRMCYLRARPARMLLVLAAAAEKHEAWSAARERSEARGRT